MTGIDLSDPVSKAQLDRRCRAPAVRSVPLLSCQDRPEGHEDGSVAVALEAWGDEAVSVAVDLQRAGVPGLQRLHFVFHGTSTSYAVNEASQRVGVSSEIRFYDEQHDPLALCLPYLRSFGLEGSASPSPDVDCSAASAALTGGLVSRRLLFSELLRSGALEGVFGPSVQLRDRRPDSWPVYTSETGECQLDPDGLALLGAQEALPR